MKIQVIKTDRITEKQPICTCIDKFLLQLPEKAVLAITSKFVSVCEGCVVPKNAISKEELVAKEADQIIHNPDASDKRIMLTYKNHMLIPSAGIDESNSNGMYILYPKNPFRSAKEVWEFFRKKYALSSLGILITDSHTTPLRRGVTGIALAWWGFSPTINCIGKPDLFDQPLRVTHINVADALAVSAVFTMGESAECTPLAILTDIPHITFNDHPHSINEICIRPQDDLYRPLLKNLL